MKKQKNDKAVILFTRIPEAGRTKTRMMPRYSGDECAQMHICFLKDIMRELRKTGADIFVCFEPSGPSRAMRKICGRARGYFAQDGEGLGERMLNAFRTAFSMGYSSCVLVGADIPELRAGDVKSAFRELDSNDAVCGPTEDGGYYLIGMRRPLPVLFEGKSYGHERVMDDLMQAASENGISMGMTAERRDMDTPDDLMKYLAAMRKDPRLRKSRTGRFVRDHFRISVIVPVYNEASTIDAMAAQLSRIKDCCEIIFADGGSTDDTAARIPAGFRVIRSPKGRAAQMNAGAAKSSGDVLFFLHCDSELPKDPLGEIRLVMSWHKAGCFGIAFHARHFFMLTNRLISNGRARCHGIMFGDQGIFMTRELFEEAGGFPELPIMEDYQLSLTLRKMGVRPGMTRHRIYTSDRRYPAKTIPKLKLMHEMYRLRKRYKSGVPADEIAKEYRDIR